MTAEITVTPRPGKNGIGWKTICFAWAKQTNNMKLTGAVSMDVTIVQNPRKDIKPRIIQSAMGLEGIAFYRGCLRAIHVHHEKGEKAKVIIKIWEIGKEVGKGEKGIGADAGAYTVDDVRSCGESESDNQ